MGIEISNFSNISKTLPFLNFKIEKGFINECQIPRHTFFHLIATIFNKNSHNGKIEFEGSRLDAKEFLRHRSYFMFENSVPKIENYTVEYHLKGMYQISRTKNHINEILRKYLNIDDIFKKKINDLTEKEISYLNTAIMMYSGKKINFLNSKIFNGFSQKEYDTLCSLLYTRASHGNAIVLFDLI
jgi:hypothetical protein